MQFAARLGAWYLQPTLLRATGYGIAAARLERIRKNTAGAASGIAAAITAGGIYRTFKKGSKGKKRPRSKMGDPMMTPRYGPGGSKALLPSKRTRLSEGGGTHRDRGGYEQLDYTKGSAGDRHNKVQRALKSLVASLYSVIDRFQHLGTGTEARGRYTLDCRNLTATPADGMLMPVYTFDLTCMTQDTTGVLGVPTYACPFNRLFFQGTGTNQFRWDNVAGVVRGYDGTALSNANQTRTWTTERGPRLVSKNLLGTTGEDPKATLRSYLDWAEVKMMIYGARNLPTQVTVSIVQFKDDTVIPDMYVTYDGSTITTPENGIATYTGNDFNKAKDFWVSLTDRLIGNPLTKRGCTKVPAMMDTLYSKTFQFNPTMTDETDARGHMVAFNFRYNLAKICDYQWDWEDALIVNNVIGQPNQWQTYRQSQNLNTTVPRKGRVYLMITGQAPQIGLNTETDLTGLASASFDLQVRRKSNHVHGIVADV